MLYTNKWKRIRHNGKESIEHSRRTYMSDTMLSFPFNLFNFLFGSFLFHLFSLLFSLSLFHNRLWWLYFSIKFANLSLFVIFVDIFFFPLRTCWSSIKCSFFIYFSLNFFASIHFVFIFFFHLIIWRSNFRLYFFLQTYRKLPWGWALQIDSLFIGYSFWFEWNSAEVW